MMGRVGVCAALVALASAPCAHAVPADNGAFSGPAGDHDAGAFWVDVNSFLPDWTVTKDRQLAAAICSKLGDGYSEGHLVAQIAEGDSSAVSDIQYVVHAAEWHFCPQYY